MCNLVEQSAAAGKEEELSSCSLHFFFFFFNSQALGPGLTNVRPRSKERQQRIFEKKNIGIRDTEGKNYRDTGY